MRITQRYLKEWLVKEFERLKIEYPIGEIYRTHCTQNQYECGAAYFIIKFGEFPCLGSIFIFYPISYLQEELNNGYELFLELKSQYSLSDAQINIRKSNKTP